VRFKVGDRITYVNKTRPNLVGKIARIIEVDDGGVPGYYVNLNEHPWWAEQSAGPAKEHYIKTYCKLLNEQEL